MEIKDFLLGIAGSILASIIYDELKKLKQKKEWELIDT